MYILIKHGEFELMPTQDLCLYVLASGTRRYSAGYQRRKVNSKPATNPLVYSGDGMPAYYAGTIVAQCLLE